jgi:hypothetical protein
LFSAIGGTPHFGQAIAFSLTFSPQFLQNIVSSFLMILVLDPMNHGVKSIFLAFTFSTQFRNP